MEIKKTVTKIAGQSPGKDHFSAELEKINNQLSDMELAFGNLFDSQDEKTEDIANKVRPQ